MLEILALGLLLADTQAQTTLPRQREDPKEQQQEFEGTPTDPLFNKPLVATDDPTFVRNAVEASRQGAFDAQSAGALSPPVDAAAQRIAQQYDATRDQLEELAKQKRWPLPPEISPRVPTVKDAAPARKSADFIASQIAAHQVAVTQYRAQLAGTKDPDLKRALRETLAGYEKNLELLVNLKYQP